MKEARMELLDFAEKNPSFVTEAITEATEGEDLSEYSTEEVIMEYLSDEVVKELLERFHRINDSEK